MDASIIILTYNQAATIARAIESVLRQKCTYSYEIVISDDGSSDNTRQIAEEYATMYPEKIRLLPQHPNLGLVGNYFHALRHCQGKYIGDCAGDDEWLDEFRLYGQIKILNSDPTISVVFTDVEEHRKESDGKMTSTLHSSDPRRRIWMKSRIPGKQLLIGSLNHTTELPYTLSAALYRKSILDKVLAVSPKILQMEETGIEDIPIIA
ncbi:MAG: glycosyltransferase, partial [Muribaculaceae bacterium]|nr:glycosyltransferase [Muribaculaceae bacterium]